MTFLNRTQWVTQKLLFYDAFGLCHKGIMEDTSQHDNK